MDNTVSLIRDYADDFGSVDSPIANTIHSDLSEFEYAELENSASAFVSAVHGLQSDIRQSDTVDDVNAAGLNDALDSLDKQFSRACGQLNASRKVIAAGAGPHKAAEYLGHSVDALAEARRQLGEPLTYFLESRAEEDDSIDTQSVITAADAFRARIEALETVISETYNELTN